ncbi:MAG: 7TM-DISM domain-containing protein, partial [Raineya sp.]
MVIGRKKLAKIMRWSYCLFWINSFWIGGASAQIVLNKENPSLNVGKSLFVLEDKKGNLDINQVSSKDFEGEFKPSEQEAFNVGVSSSAFWLRLDLQSKDTQIKDWLLYSPYSFLDEVTLYQQNEKGTWKGLSLGLEQKFDERPIKHRYIIFPFTLKDTLVHRFFIKIQSQTPIQFPLY